ncbi:MAG: hypothetical protein B6244_08285 [Candidatus Cloacimonetes bacterium 4572_55]|nr:MAG: hypothetical protein B6244_08285 [Candidatus Cloacimonetes bacterium 4572_55]
MIKMKIVLLLLLMPIINIKYAYSEPDSAVIAEAMKEGKLVWYSSAVKDACWRILYEFEETYPFIETTLFQGGSNKIQDKFEEEIKSGNIEADVIHVSLPTAFHRWRDGGNLAEYHSKEYAAFPPQYKDDGWWASARNITVCIAYNSQTLPSDKAPKTWSDLLDEKWDGKLIVGNPLLYGTRQVQYYALRTEFGKEFWHRISELAQRVEKPRELKEFFLDPKSQVSVTYLGYFYDRYSIKLGEPVRAVWPKDGVPLVQSPVAIAKNSPHPNAAKLFLDFILSREGQALFQVLAGDYSVRDDVPPMPGKLPFDELNIIPIDWDDFEYRKQEYLMEFQELFDKQLQKNLLEETEGK